MKAQVATAKADESEGDETLHASLPETGAEVIDLKGDTSPEVSEAIESRKSVLNRAHYETVIAGFKESTELSKSFAREAAELSLLQFEEHGDLQYVYDLLDAIEAAGKNYVRKAAYISWLAAHAPVVWDKDGKKLVKDKAKNAVPFNLDGAFEKAFWDFKPDTEVAIFNKMDLVQALQRTVKRYSNEKKFKAANKATENVLEKAEEMIATLAA